MRGSAKIYVQQKGIAFCEFSILKLYIPNFRISLEKTVKWKCRQAANSFPYITFKIHLAYLYLNI